MAPLPSGTMLATHTPWTAVNCAPYLEVAANGRVLARPRARQLGARGVLFRSVCEPGSGVDKVLSDGVEVREDLG
jgi:hypothetical protein